MRAHSRRLADSTICTLEKRRENGCNQFSGTTGGCHSGVRLLRRLNCESGFLYNIDKIGLFRPVRLAFADPKDKHLTSWGSGQNPPRCSAEWYRLPSSGLPWSYRRVEATFASNGA